MTFYASGEGLTDGANVAGVITQAPYPHPLLPVIFKIAGVETDLQYAGAAQAELTVGAVTVSPVTIWLR